MSEHEKPLLNDGFQLLETELEFAMGVFGEVLNRLGHEDLALKLPWSGRTLPAVEASDRSIGQAYSIA